MKTNSLHIFDKVTATEGWRSMAHGELAARAAEIGLADRGIQLDPVSLARLADALDAARGADLDGIRAMRRTLAR